MKTDLISRSELFNKLATVPIKAESVETTTEIFKIINSMQTESGGLSESDMEIFCDDYCRYPYICVYQEDLERICDKCMMNNGAPSEIQTNTAPDLISRADAVNEIHKYFVEEINKTPYTKDEDGDEVYTDMPTVESLLVCNKELSKRIKSLPSASVEVGAVR